MNILPTFILLFRKKKWRIPRVVGTVERCKWLQRRGVIPRIECTDSLRSFSCVCFVLVSFFYHPPFDHIPQSYEFAQKMLFQSQNIWDFTRLETTINNKLLSVCYHSQLVNKLQADILH